MSILRDKKAAASFGRAVAAGQAAKRKTGKQRGPRWTEQRDAFKRAGTTASMLMAWLGCSYLRARDLRSGHAMLRGEEFAAIMQNAPATAIVLRDTMKPKDVRQRGLFDGEDVT